MTPYSKRVKAVSLLALSLLSWHAGPTQAVIAQEPLFLTTSVPPLVMLTMDRSHKLYYEAYNDAGDVDGDGQIDVGFKPGIDYFGYFDSNRCYDYNTADGLFEPKDEAVDKKCSSVAGDWSGNFLNYVTTSRIDALRKVLYGGMRSVDTTTGTVLKRAFIPQDAHSWGKEYNPASSGYLIADYTPYSEPPTGRSHLFANVSLAYNGQPLLRVLDNTKARIWEWVSIERPVAGNDCNFGGTRKACAEAGGSKWVVVPSTVLSELERKTYDTNVTTYPANASDYSTFITTHATSDKLKGTDSMTTLQSNGNPFQGNKYLTVVKGKITVPTTGSYKFAVDGDDAVEVLINGTVVAGWYGGHGTCGCNDRNGSITLTAGTHAIEYHHQEATGGDSFVLRWEETSPASTITDYNVNVKVCESADKKEANCKAYTDKDNNTIYKPKGLLQDYGENDSMAFGLLTGSYKKNISGGVLRKNIESFKNEVDLETGIFKNVNGIVKTLNSLRVDTFNYGSYAYGSGWITTRAINEGEAAEWGNPVGEMMYETLRYFAGKKAPSPAFAISATDTPDANMGLPLPSWLDPYASTDNSGGGFLSCAKPVQMVISDINPSYDTDQLPGSHFNTYSGDLSGLDVGNLADKIWASESEASKVFIGQSGTVSDNAPTAKSASSFKSIRGLAPEEPTKMGGYYAASVALHGARNDLNSAGPSDGNDYQKDQKTSTFSVALASPLPKIEIPVIKDPADITDATPIMTLVPFAKSVGGSGIDADKTKFQPTNQIVDFYIEKIANTNAGNIDAEINGGRPYGKFRINYEDVEQSADHDMDAIVEYTFAVNASLKLVVELNSSYAAGGIIQHMGYVISGSTADGVYLEVRDIDTGAGSDPDYFLDTPPGQLPGGTWNDSQPLPLIASRTFTAGATKSASYIKHDPLWYAAKWGSTDKDKDGVLDADEWDDDGNGAPDNYFLVTNAGKLSEQLGKAFAKLVEEVSSASAVATNSTALNTETLLFQAKFDPRDWSGQLLALEVNLTTGEPNIKTPNWDAAQKLPDAASRKIYTYNPVADKGSRLVEFVWDNPAIPTVPELTSSQKAYLNELNGTYDGLGPDRVQWLRGDSSKEKRVSDGIFRNRIKSSVDYEFVKDAALLQDPATKTIKLGDIVNSDPLYVAETDYGYGTQKGLTTEESTKYIEFRKSTIYTTRKPIVYAGANDGMLHGFDASFGTGGAEVFAYIPNSLFPNLSWLTAANYKHKYYADGINVANDVYFSANSEWRTVLAGTTGAGGKGVFALDVTDPSTIHPSKALWELTGDDATYGANLGYTIGEPVFARLHNGRWAVIFGNGYSSTNGSASLFIVDAESGDVIKHIETGYTGDNGLSSPTVADYDNNHIADAIYAGDLKGNLWKFDISDANPSNWVVENSKPLFVACAVAGPSCSASDRQPITAKPGIGKVGTDQGTGVMVYFGTGKYYESTDNVVGASPQVQSLYGLWDDRTATNSIDDKSQLQEQSITFEGTPITVDNKTGSGTVRVTSRNTLCYSASTQAAADDDDPEAVCESANLKKGWFMNLVKPVNIAQGERVYSPPVFFNSLVIFSSGLPSADPCLGGGKSRIMLLEALTGKRPSTSPFDIFGAGEDDSVSTTPDNDVNEKDLVKTNVDDKAGIVASGTDLGIGMHKEIVIVGRFGYASGSTGNMGKITLEPPPGPPGGGGGGGVRKSWRQLR